ncbi:hypothetical protein ATJ88_3482 [Isoptericola jiangsuensis]|uniref:Uncharacterized protein n=1 Tax=Isoptericola jiangsuensis TaxID=548579 RepID=A0A2A9F1Q5_9MICO|nr:hypothetical protein [Isoptericola jiangsuensis]PFG44746.1 hypothetical protein ATJ88_3482 [Isoptericola jiangsuensis]
MSQLMFGPALEAELAYHRELLDAAYGRAPFWQRVRARTTALRSAVPHRHRRTERPLVHRHA